MLLYKQEHPKMFNSRFKVNESQTFSVYLFFFKSRGICSQYHPKQKGVVANEIRLSRLVKSAVAGEKSAADRGTDMSDTLLQITNQRSNKSIYATAC